MIIKQKFKLGDEESCGEEFFSAVPKELYLLSALEEALKVIFIGVEGYTEFFTLQLDTELRSVEVIEVI